jgi:SHS2 domain-containing protein
VYTWVEHTGELELAIEAKSEVAVFAEALAALGELLGEEVGDQPAFHEVELRADDRPALLAEWLSELVFLAESEDFVPGRVVSIALEGNRLRATVEGLRDAPRHLVKAITYHGLSLARVGGVWKATVVLDV